MATLGQLSASDGDLLRAVEELNCPTDATRFGVLLDTLRKPLSVKSDAIVWFASSPGRTELAGNHTDHNRGKVLAAAVNLDTVAAVAVRNDSRVRVISEGFPPVDVDLDNLEIDESERESTAALVRGIARALANNGRRVGGLDIAMSSKVRAGSGLSSSASVEVLIGTVFSAVFNDGEIGATEIAIAGRFAENHYFGKPSGLMDQLACATGGTVAIDFRDETSPAVEKIDVSFADAGLALCVVDTGGSHADLTHEYASVPAEMHAIAKELGTDVLRDAPEEEFYTRLHDLRNTCGDRAVTRALHFFEENRRVDTMVSALKRLDFAEYLALMAESGRSSAMFLQNVAPQSTSRDQAVSVALALTEHFFTTEKLRNGRDGACRVHGGGFAGTIQVLLPSDRLTGYRSFLVPHLGKGAVTQLQLRHRGSIATSMAMEA